MTSRAKKARKRARTANKLPAYMQHVAFTKWSGEKEREQRNRRGTFGPASEVRILVKDGKPVE